jgi:hypothetical protein
VGHVAQEQSNGKLNLDGYYVCSPPYWLTQRPDLLMSANSCPAEQAGGPTGPTGGLPATGSTGRPAGKCMTASGEFFEHNAQNKVQLGQVRPNSFCNGQDGLWYSTARNGPPFPRPLAYNQCKMGDAPYNHNQQYAPTGWYCDSITGGWSTVRLPERR